MRCAEPEAAYGLTESGSDDDSIKIVIAGNRGGGQLWLANTLGAIATTPVIHLDDFAWSPGNLQHERLTKDAALRIEQIRRTDRWVVAGSFVDIAAPLLEDADALIWLNFHWAACRDGLQPGRDGHYGVQPRVTSDAGLTKLVEWASAYQSRGESFAGHLSLFRRFEGCRLCVQTEEEAIGLVDLAMQIGVHDALQDAAGRLNSPRWR